MSANWRDIARFLAGSDASIYVDVRKVSGSTPREAGAFMLVSASETLGTIGGGQLEYLAIDAARKLLISGQSDARLDVPLGPEIGQCCGGRADIGLCLAHENLLAEIVGAAKARDAAQPEVLVFGAGHVGRALALALARLPIRTTLIDTRAHTLGDLPEGISGRIHDMPEMAVREAGPGTAFVIATHDHALDFTIVREALMRGDAAYTGMVGSKTKRARFASFFRSEGGTPAQLAALITPIGGDRLVDKRPEVIAALTVAELLVQLGRCQILDSAERDRESTGWRWRPGGG